jgi:hypothetical protein
MRIWIPVTALTVIGLGVVIVWGGRNATELAGSTGGREFAAEHADPSWAPVAKAKILDRFVQMPGLALISLEVECRATMCLVQVASPDSAGATRPQFNILFESIGLEPRWLMAIADTSGTLQSIAYLWREDMAPVRPGRAEGGAN